MKYSMSVELQNKLYDIVLSIAACLFSVANCTSASADLLWRFDWDFCVHSSKVQCTCTRTVYNCTPQGGNNNSFINWSPIKIYHCLATTHHNTIVRIARTIDLNAKTLETCSRRARRSNCILKNKWRRRRCTLGQCCALRSAFATHANITTTQCNTIQLGI